MWVEPLGSFQRMFAKMVAYAGGHDNPNFFMGQIVDDPGPFFYPIAYFVRSTPATLIGLLAAAVAGWRGSGPLGRPSVRRTAFGMLFFALAFTVLMTIVGKKFDRYLLPAFLALDVVAAIGWVALAQALAAVVRRRRGAARGDRSPLRTSTTPTWSLVAAGVVVCLALGPLHGLFTALHYPYYMTYYNPLAGGTQTAPQMMFVGWGEGLEQVGAWLNQQPDAENRQAISWYATGPLSYFFGGKAIGVQYGSRAPWLDADYVVLYINQVQRKIPTAAMVDYFLQQTPVLTVTAQSMPMARVYDLHAIVSGLMESAPPACRPARAGCLA